MKICRCRQSKQSMRHFCGATRGRRAEHQVQHGGIWGETAIHDLGLCFACQSSPLIYLFLFLSAARFMGDVRPGCAAAGGSRQVSEEGRGVNTSNSSKRGGEEGGGRAALSHLFREDTVRNTEQEERSSSGATGFVASRTSHRDATPATLSRRFLPPIKKLQRSKV